MQAFIIKLVIQSVIPIVFKLIGACLKNLASRTDTTIDDAFVNTFFANEDKMVEEVQKIAKDKTVLKDAQKK